MPPSDPDDPDRQPGEAEDPVRPAGAASVDEVEDRLESAGDPYVRATVVRREPPVSATVGARAVVTPDGELHGWIGGVECARDVVVERALEALAADRPKLVGLAPDPSTVERPGIEAFRLTCHSGGTLEVFLEPVSPGPELLVVGGSPIAATLASIAPTVGFEVTVVDQDAGDGDYPAATRVIGATDPGAMGEAVGEGAYVVVASVGEFDARGVVAGIQRGARYLGLVASEERAREVCERAADSLGIDPEGVREAVSSPAGIDVGSETPEEIAVSVLAELIEVRRRGGETRGGPVSLPGSAGTPGDSRGEQSRPEGDPVATDPVCGMEVDAADPAASVERDGETYYFCSVGCADAFEASPGEYLEST